LRKIKSPQTRHPDITKLADYENFGSLRTEKTDNVFLRSTEVKRVWKLLANTLSLLTADPGIVSFHILLEVVKQATYALTDDLHIAHVLAHLKPQLKGMIVRIPFSRTKN